MRFNRGIKIVKRNLGMIFCLQTTPCRNAGVNNWGTERAEQIREGEKKIHSEGLSKEESRIKLLHRAFLQLMQSDLCRWMQTQGACQLG